MAKLLFITHTDVVIDPDTPVPQWKLSETGRARAAALPEREWIANVTRLFSSDEVKAVETAAFVADALGLTVEVRQELGENRRTRFVPPEEFEVLADAFFAEPEVSVEGWETAVDAQSRIVAATADLLADSGEDDVAVISHGGVGTLLYCHLAGVPINREYDQPHQGSWFAVDRATGRPDGPYRSID